MKLKQLFFFSSTALILNGYSQVDEVILDGNGVAATISNNGFFFSKPTTSTAGYEFPKGSANHLVFRSSMWFGATDEEGNLKMAAMHEEEYPGGETGFFKGALTADGTATAGASPQHGEVYKVSQAEIDYHIAHAGEAGYTIPHGILNWPAHGDVTLGFDYYLAPFVDLDGNGDYNPETGDFPAIRGDYAAYFILNDKGGVHAYNPLGIEMHYMFYQFNADNYIDSTTFLHLRVINRSTTDYPSFITSHYMDYDIGRANNDLFGTNEENDVIYGYNGLAADDGAGAGSGYSFNPPALGVVSLNRKLNAGSFFFLDGYGSAPTAAEQRWNRMNGNMVNGEPFTYKNEGDSIVRYLYSGNPTGIGTDDWKDQYPEDKVLLGSAEAVPLSSGESLCYDYAFIATQQEGNFIANAGRIIELAAEVKAFYATQPNYCDFTLSLPDVLHTKNIAAYPNPSNGEFTVELAGDYNIHIYTMDGRVVYEQNHLTGKQLLTTNLSAGQYVITYTQGEIIHQEKLIIQ